MGGPFDFKPPGPTLVGGGLFGLAQTKRKIFVSYHHGRDRAYYDALSSTFHDHYDVIYDNSPERRIDSETVDYVRRRLSEEYITGSSCTLVFAAHHRRCGDCQWRRAYLVAATDPKR